jgi:hypothetical protein
MSSEREDIITWLESDEGQQWSQSAHYGNGRPEDGRGSAPVRIMQAGWGCWGIVPGLFNIKLDIECICGFYPETDSYPDESHVEAGYRFTEVAAGSIDQDGPYGEAAEYYRSFGFVPFKLQAGYGKLDD